MKKSMLFGLLLVALAPSANQALAAPLCRSVLQSFKPKTANAIEVSIHEIAEMKLQYDLLKLHGLHLETAQKAFTLQFPEKYQELVRELHDQLSEKEILELVKKEVRRLQGRKDEKNTKEAEVRAEERKLLGDGPETRSYKYVLKTQGLKSMSDIQGSTSAVYFPQSHKVFFVAEGALYAGKPGSTEKYLFDADSFVLLSDHKTLLIRQDLQFLTFDLATEKVIATRDINFTKSDATKEFEEFVIDPTEKYALLTGEFPDKAGTALSIINLTSNTEVLGPDQLPAKLNAAKFLDGEHLAVLHDQNKLSVINIASGKTVQNTTLSISPTSFIPNLAVAKNGRMIAIFDKFKMITVETSNISRELESSTIESGSPNSRTAKHAAGYKHALMEVDFYSGAKIFNMETLEVEFDFNGKYHRDADGLFRMIPSADGESILAVYSSQGRNQTHRIDLWEREQAEP